MMKYILSIFAIFIISCGYKPVSKITHDSFGSSIFIKVKISLNDPVNTVSLQDEIKQVFARRLNKTLTTEKLAQTKLYVKIQNLNFKPIVYDGLGYVIFYEAKVSLNFKKINHDLSIDEEITSGTYQFAIEPNSVISYQKRYFAIKNAASNAFEEYISKTSIKEIMKKKTK